MRMECVCVVDCDGEEKTILECVLTGTYEMVRPIQEDTGVRTCPRLSTQLLIYLYKFL